MKYNNTELMEPVMDLIRKYDPNKHEAMMNTYWPVTAVSSMDDMLPIAKEVGVSRAMEIASTVNDGLGLTVQKMRDTPETAWEDEPKPLWHTSWLNVPGIIHQARRMNVVPFKLGATVLVHEWTHRRGYGEPEAYAAGEKFAFTMSEPEIARSQRETGARVAREQADRERMIGQLGSLLRGMNPEMLDVLLKLGA
jgi:hypothetical protein